MQVRLASETDFDGFRAHARGLLARGIAPAQVEWLTPGQAGLFEDAADPADDNRELAPVASPNVPAAFVTLCGTVVLHRHPQRFALLYRMLWRLTHEPALRHDPLDPDMLLARQMAQAVRRDIHKMHAFVRFRPVQEDAPDGQPLYVAWFEPEHHIVAANGPWFSRRFANMRWAILSPDCCVEWDRKVLTVRPGTGRENAPPADAGEALWLTYYRSIFNPARLKLDMMRKEMPRKYWHNLPEAQLIPQLAAQAHERAGMMIEAPATTPRRRIPVHADTEPPPAVARDSLPSLRDAVMQCRECPLGAAATHGVCGEGPLRPALMLVGEQPGDREDLAGRPFVGPAGQLLDRAMAQAGIVREQAFLSNAVRHFKYELRGRRRIHKTPSQQEALACRHWLEEEIAMVQPQVLVALGATAARSLLGRQVAVLSERGRWHQRADGGQVLVTLHPSALLRMPEQEQDAAFAAFVADLALAAAGPGASQA